MTHTLPDLNHVVKTIEALLTILSSKTPETRAITIISTACKYLGRKTLTQEDEIVLPLIKAPLDRAKKKLEGSDHAIALRSYLGDFAEKSIPFYEHCASLEQNTPQIQAMVSCVLKDEAGWRNITQMISNSYGEWLAGLQKNDPTHAPKGSTIHATVVESGAAKIFK